MIGTGKLAWHPETTLPLDRVVALSEKCIENAVGEDQLAPEPATAYDLLQLSGLAEVEFPVPNCCRCVATDIDG